MLSTNFNHSSDSTPRNENATQKLIRENVDFLIQQLEAGQSDALTSYLTAMSHFHNYSFGNILQIARQKPDATLCANMSETSTPWTITVGRRRKSHLGKPLEPSSAGFFFRCVGRFGA